MVKDREKVGLRFEVRVILAAISGAILGGGIVATFGPALHPFFYAEGVPDWAAVWTMRWNAALFFAAVLSFVTAFVAVVYAKRGVVAAFEAAEYAKRGVETILMTERLKRTEEQVSRFEEASLQAAYNAQVEPGKEGLSARQVAAEQRFLTKIERDQMVDLVNYLGWVTTLTDAGLHLRDAACGAERGRPGGLDHIEPRASRSSAEAPTRRVPRPRRSRSKPIDPRRAQG